MEIKMATLKASGSEHAWVLVGYNDNPLPSAEQLQHLIEIP